MLKMSYTTVKNFVLILMFSAAQCRPAARSKRQMPGMGGMGMGGMGMGGMMGGMGGMGAPPMPGMGGGMGGMGGGMGMGGMNNGMADIGINMDDFKDVSKVSEFPGVKDVSNFAGTGGSSFDNLGAASGLGGTSMAEVGGNTMWADFQDIVKSVGASSPSLEGIGVKMSDFPSPADFQQTGQSPAAPAAGRRPLFNKQVSGSFHAI